MNIAWETGLVIDEVDRKNNVRSDLGPNEYKLAFESIVLPLAKEFAPDVILISCGFDAGIGDPIGWSKLCPLMYFWMTRQLCLLCEKVLVVQEGGYNTEFMKFHAEAVLKGLLCDLDENIDIQDYFGLATSADIEAGF